MENARVVKLNHDDYYTIQFRKKLLGLIDKWYFIHSDSKENYSLTTNPYNAYKYATEETAQNHIEEVYNKLREKL